MTGAITGALLYVVLGPIVGGLLSGIDRKITARLQGRQGPPLLQPFYDVFKLFAKENLVVNQVQDFLICAFFFFAVFSGGLFFAGGDLLLVFFALTLAEAFFIMAACSANSPYSFMGAQRELVQIMSYEPMMLLAAIGFYMASGTFAVRNILEGEMPPIVYLPGIFIGFVYILTIKFRKSPFDLSTSHHAHQEMVSGSRSDLSGNILALVELSHWYETVFLLGVVALFFSGFPVWVAVLACALVYFLEILIDNTFSRMRWQHMLKSAWGVTMVAGVANLLILSFIR